MTLELPNYTLIIQFLLFVMAFGVLNVFIFSPFLQVIEARRKKTVDAIKRAEHLSKEATAILSQYELKLREQKEQIRKRTEQARQELNQKQSKHLEGIRADLLKNMNLKKQEIQKNTKIATEELSKEVEKLSEELSQKFLGVLL